MGGDARRSCCLDFFHHRWIPQGRAGCPYGPPLVPCRGVDPIRALRFPDGAGRRGKEGRSDNGRRRTCEVIPARVGPDAGCCRNPV